MAKCTFSVKDGIDKDGNVTAACSCAGSDDIKGKGFLSDVIKQGFGTAGRAVGGVIAGVAEFIFWDTIGGSTPRGTYGKAEGLTDATASIAMVAETGDYADFSLELHPCVKESWKDTKKINVDWNGLGSLAGIEGIRNVEEITANHNNIKVVPDLNTMPSLEKLDLQYNKIPRFNCGGKRFASMKFDKEEIGQIRSCQARKTIKYDVKRTFDERWEEWGEKMDESGFTKKVDDFASMFG
jgi:hypothetical protein